MNAAIYPGTFDPLTFGHLDVIERASRIFERLIVAVGVNRSKTPLFTVAERMEMVREVVQHLPHVEVDSFNGLLVEYCRSKQVHALIRGLRAFSDFEYEFQMALTNRKLAPEIETIFLMPKETHSYLSSSMVRGIAAMKGNIDDFVPRVVRDALDQRVRPYPQDDVPMNE
jgi:pantetheine-phosphate adenylyltransferase